MHPLHAEGLDWLPGPPLLADEEVSRLVSVSVRQLALLLIAVMVPGVIAGSVIHVEVLPSPRVFHLVVAAILIPPLPVVRAELRTASSSPATSLLMPSARCGPSLLCRHRCQYNVKKAQCR